MLKHLTFSVDFPHTMKSFSGSHNFESGLTTITGPNEAGKSLRLEMIRYALFGTKALRSTSGKYKNLKVTLDFTVKEIPYRVDRKSGNATVYRGTDPIAVGTSPVNAKVAEIFGYGLEVFDSAHAVNQGQIEALGSMTSGDRKKMVDNVIGLNVLDDLIKFATESAALFRKEAETIQGMIVEPVHPLRPEDYQPSAEIQVHVQNLRTQKAELDQIRGQLMQQPNPPAWPSPEVEESVEDLEAVQARRQEVATSLRVLSAKYAVIPDPRFAEADLYAMEDQFDAHEAWLAYKKLMAALPFKPVMTLGEIKIEQKVIDEHTTWSRKKMLFDTHKTTCPNCDHTFGLGYDDPGPEPTQPNSTVDILTQQRQRNEAWEKAPTLVPECEAPPLTRREHDVEVKALAQAQSKAEIGEKIDVLAAVDIPDVSLKLKKRRAFDTAWAVAQKQQDTFDAFEAKKLVLQARLTELVDCQHLLPIVEKTLQDALMFEREWTIYEKAQEAYHRQVEKLALAEAQADQFKRARGAILTLKGKVKSHLVPSLSRVASHLLGQMTGGRRASIAIDEDFNIKVDDQDLDELSGSAKAVANLSIRLGLGQVLTNRVFSVFMGDELDAAMDIDRAGFTAECLRNLTGKIKQVVLVTHKRPDADHFIELT